MDSKQAKTAASNSKYGTLTAESDANNDYAASNTTGNTPSAGTDASSQIMTGAPAGKQQASKSKYGTYTATSDANQDYK